MNTGESRYSCSSVLHLALGAEYSVTAEVASSSLVVPAISSRLPKNWPKQRGNRKEQRALHASAPDCVSRCFGRIIVTTLACASRLAGVVACVYVSSVIRLFACWSDSCTVFTVRFQQHCECVSERVPADSPLDRSTDRRWTDVPAQQVLRPVRLLPAHLCTCEYPIVRCVIRRQAIPITETACQLAVERDGFAGRFGLHLTHNLMNDCSVETDLTSQS
jgi:hypothetical protein